ncbi:MAG: hypothetical protein B7733_02100 [Myxococcales bacterium FL481]|nr:MAG: hypothetical protein B7733_02100 [Myxococcales bacterium FL481]
MSETTVANPPQRADSEADQEKRPHERYTHNDVLTRLRNDDSVIPEAPPVHAIHTMYNREAIVPPMCYTRTEGQHNPCYVCHQDRIKGRPNVMNDGELQQAYSFSEVATQNQWRNLFEDRTKRVAQISDADILAWIAQDNYSELAPRLREVAFEGYIPDLNNLQLAADAFDSEGFARDGSGWVAFNYKPMPSTFWPTNGATDDVMIRLPAAFRTTVTGEYSREVYRANLALVEANIKGFATISVRDLDERVVGEDLNGDRRLGTIQLIKQTEKYVGAARTVLRQPFLYPQDTEFLHSVRYIGVDAAGNVFVPPRMKELRYMRKRWAVSEPQLYEAYMQEHDAKDVGQLPGYIDRGQYGFDNEMGWVVAGFIENRNGRLRVNTFEENFFCMGCHTSLGSTIDSTFSFARKVDGAAGWGYINLRGMPDAPNLGERRGEIATYLERAGGGGEFRSNPEMVARWFTNGVVDQAKVAAAKDVYELVTPSRERALRLNKAYRVLVEDQDFLYGRDATVTPPANVYDVVDNENAPTLPQERTFSWDIRLDWSPRVD